jgi:hypothetical protein
MSDRLRNVALLAAIAVALSPSAVLAQDGTPGSEAERSLAETEGNQERNESGFPWGLLGLLGLAGLLPRKRKEPRRRYTDH